MNLPIPLTPCAGRGWLADEVQCRWGVVHRRCFDNYKEYAA